MPDEFHTTWKQRRMYDHWYRSVKEETKIMENRVKLPPNGHVWTEFFTPGWAHKNYWPGYEKMLRLLSASAYAEDNTTRVRFIRE